MSPELAYDYSLTGPASTSAVREGLADAEWYRSPVDPDRLAHLTQRTNVRAAVDVVVWVSLLVGSGALAWSVRGTWWALPAFAAYGALYGGAADARWHECGHGTAFRSRLLNDLVYYPASFLLLREPTVWRWSHVRHHSDTIIRGRDAEIVFPRPMSFGAWIANLVGLIGVPTMLRRIVRHAGGRIGAAERSYVPESELRKVVVEARIYVTILAAVTVWAVSTRSIYPLLFIGLPTFYGSWLVLFFGTTQHAGLRENVLDHRLNTRTVLMNPVFRFLYLNMNYHVEHHMFPTVPYRNLPLLHEEIRDDLPPPVPSTAKAYREIWTAVRAQRRDPTWELERELPATASASQSPLTSITVVAENGAVRLCGSDELAPGHLRRVDAGDRTFVLVRTAAGKLHLTDGICTHSRRVHLADGSVVGGDIECPKHNGRFDAATGEATREPACDALRTYAVREVDGEIVADLA